MIGSEAADRIAAGVGRRAATVLTATLKLDNICHRAAYIADEQGLQNPLAFAQLGLGIWSGRPQVSAAPDAYRGARGERR